MPKTHGYGLPSGDAFTDELCCALVFYPDKDEYRRALLGAVTYFETWLAWELDSSKRGKDAARAWSLANERTLECWNMACLDDLIADMAAVRVLLENSKDCCDDSVTYGIQDDVETEITPQLGDPPDYYGETAIADWDEWSEHVCYNAHVYVDNLKNIGAQLNGAVGQNALYLGLIAAGLVLLSFVGIGLPIAYLLASFVVTGLVAAATSSTFADTSDDIEDARDIIVCRLLTGGNIADAVEDALGSGPAWDLFYQFIDYDSATAIIHEGGGAGEYLPDETRDDCACTEGYELIVVPAPGGAIVDQTHYTGISGAGGCWICGQLRVVLEGTSSYRPFKIISMEALAPAQCPTYYKFRVYDYPGETLIYDSNTPPSNLSNCKYVVVLAISDFGTREIIWEVE